MTRKSKRGIKRILDDLAEEEPTDAADVEDRPVFAYRTDDGEYVDEQGRAVDAPPIFGIKGGRDYGS